MIDLSKYTKVYSWNSYHGRVFFNSIIASPACFMIKIGDSTYIGQSNRLAALANHHLMLLRRGKHPNKAMQDVFNEVKEFDLYILEQLPLHSCIPEKRAKYYIEQLKPDLNEGHKDLIIERELCSHPKDGERVSFYIEPGVKACIDKLCKKHDVTFDEIVYSAVLSFLQGYKYTSEHELNQEGIAYMAEALYTNLSDTISKIDDD